jgi:ankyrin repeat protein
MVEFLVEHGADVDVCDNEGWTPLHATASCGFTEIARSVLLILCFHKVYKFKEIYFILF